MQTVEREEIVRLPYELLPWQSAVKEDPHRFKTIHAGRRSGKTHLLCDLLIEAALTYAQGLPCWYVAPTYGMAKDIAWTLLKDMTADLYRVRLITRYYETELKIDFRNGASIHLKGAENLDALRGRGLGFLGLDEIAQMHRDVWLKVLRPAVSDHLAPVVFIGTPKGYNYFWELCEMEKADPKLWKKFHIKTSEAGTIPELELAQARRDLDPQSFRQEYEASFETFAGQIFHWDEVELPALSFDEVWYGGDFGYSVDPAAVIKIYRKADEYWLKEVVYLKGLTNPELAQAMKMAGIDGQMAYFDAAEPKSIEELRRAGLSVYPCEKGPDSVRAGIDFLKSKKIHIIKGSENLIREHRSYQWRTDKNGAELPEPVKFDDHCLIAGTMVTTGRGQVPIESVTTEDVVITRGGWRPVVSSGMTSPSAMVMTARFSNGARLTGTGNHLVWTENRGYISLDTMRYGDIIKVCEQNELSTTKADDSALAVALLSIGSEPDPHPVFNLTIDGTPEFYANGVLVHNCMDAARYGIFTHCATPGLQVYDLR